MFRPGEIEGASLGVEGAFSELERRIMDDIVRRIRINGEITRSADWQLHRLHELGAGRADLPGFPGDARLPGLFRQADDAAVLRRAS